MNRETQLARLLDSVSRWKRRPPPPPEVPVKDRLLADRYDDLDIDSDGGDD